MSFEIKTKNSLSVPVERISTTSSPVEYYPDLREMELRCTFKGWPRPRVVWSNPNNKQIINGSEGFYISEQLVGKDTLTSILRNADIQEKHAGAYKCTGMNNITNWSSRKSGYIDLNYRCESFNFLFLILDTDAQNYLLWSRFIKNIIPCFPCSSGKYPFKTKRNSSFSLDLDGIKIIFKH